MLGAISLGTHQNLRLKFVQDVSVAQNQGDVAILSAASQVNAKLASGSDYARLNLELYLKISVRHPRNSGGTDLSGASYIFECDLVIGHCWAIFAYLWQLWKKCFTF